MRGFNTLRKEVMAGLLIGISGAVYLKTLNPVLFSFGLLAIISLKLNLFTGRLCVTNDGWYKNLIGNSIGASIIGLALSSDLKELAITACNRFNKPWWLLFILAILCNICIGVAVYSNSLVTIFAVTVFVACGFEHCIADIFYMTAGRVFSWKIFVVILGNVVGGLIMRGGQST